MRTPLGRTLNLLNLNLNNLLSISSSRHYFYHQFSSFQTLPNNNTQFIQQLQAAKPLNWVLSSHSKLLKSGFINQTFPSNHLLNAYIRCHSMENAHHLFDEMPQPNIVSWTSLMGGYIAAGHPKTALRLFAEMPKTLVLPNAFTLSTAINACTILSDINAGKIVHACVEIQGYQSNLIVCSSLINLYGKSNHLGAAKRVFDSMPEKNIVSWTSMIDGYVQNAQPYEALRLFNQYNRSTTQCEPPNEFMLACAVSACASLGGLLHGEATHTVIIKRGHESNHVVACGLVDMYAKCGCVEFSLNIFRTIRNPKVVPYTSMIISAAKHGLVEASLELFEEMISKGITPNDVTFLGVLYACGHSGLVDKGLDLLASMQTTHNVIPDVKHYTCVVDMLARRGRLDEAYRLAKSIEIQRDQEGARLWGALLSASRVHKRLEIAAEAMVEAGQQVDSAYVTMSNACALAGNWDDADKLRSEMKGVGVRKEPGRSWVEVGDSA